MISLLINGACGLMGHVVIRMALAQADAFQVLGGVDLYGGGTEVEGVPVYATLAEAPQNADVVIDFSRPEAVPALLAYCEKNGARLVLCTTGLSEAEFRQLDHAAARVPIFQSGNMSLGVNLQIELIKNAAAALGDPFDVEIIETHHNRKVDSPSGTALMLADAVRGQYPTERQFIFGRHGKDTRRKPAEIGIHAVRGGTVVGEHDVGFFGQDEVIHITHKAYSKQVFAAGALRAAQYMMEKSSGRYNMQDIVTEHDVLSHIYADDAQAVLTLSGLPNEPGVMQAIFGAVAGEGIFVDMISMTSAEGKTAQISFSLPKSQLATAMNVLQPLRGKYPALDLYALDNLTKITVEGQGMALRHGVAAELFAVLAKAGACIELVTTSETKISCCVKHGHADAAIKAIRENFEL